MSVADQLRDEGMKKGIEKGRKEGIEEGRQKGRREFARKMLQLNIDVEQIIATTGFSAEEIEQLKKTLN